ncbi:MAG: phosphatase PAP2 family protein [Bacteroidia bacterium]
MESALSQVIKRWLNGPRPLRLQAWEMRSIEGEVWQEQLAMPSGHTAAAVLALWMLSRLPQTRAMGLQMLLGLWALAVGYSRIYLGQHSLDDVIAGACLGMVTGLIFDQVQKRAFDKSLLSP